MPYSTIMKEEQEINKKRKSDYLETQVSKSLKAFDEEENDSLELSLSSYASRRTDITLSDEPPPLIPTTTLPQQQEQPQPMVSQSLSTETLISQSPPQFPLQLSATHPIYSVPFVVEDLYSAPPVYPQEPVLSSTLAVPGTGPGPSRPVRVRRNPTQAPREGKSETITPPFPWATTHRATVHSMNYLLSKQIFTISGDVQCKRCERRYEISYDLQENFKEIGIFIAKNKHAMHDRAPPAWMNPVLPKCKFCNQDNSAKPVISEKKKSINWLFLLLGQMLGCCTLEQLKYLCKHTKNHRTGAKDRVLYLTYLSLCKQLDPDGPFSR